MKQGKLMKFSGFLSLFTALTVSALVFQSCSSFNYKTYDEKSNEGIDDPDPNYALTLDENFQDFTNYMFIGNRIENFSTYFNTYFNATEDFDVGYEDYATKVLATYSERQTSIYTKPVLSQEAIDKFNKAIEKASKIIQYHKSSHFMDRSVMLVGKSYFYLGDYLKAERKFSEFISKLNKSPLIDEALLYLARTQLRLENEGPAVQRLNDLIKSSMNRQVVSESYQSLAEYYLNKKDNANAIKNFKKAIEYSNDNEFKAQMQFLVGTVTAIDNPKAAAVEFNKVLDYNASFDLEYLARYNYAKNLILSNEFSRSKNTLEDLEVKYKDNAPYLGQISYMNGAYYEQKKDFKSSNSGYYEVIRNFPSTIPSADASFRIGSYYESIPQDYLNALRYYRFSTEQNGNGTNHAIAMAKINTFKRYFELRSIITGVQISTEYDAEFKRKTNTGGEGDPNDPGKTLDGDPKGGSLPGNNFKTSSFQTNSFLSYNYFLPADSNTTIVDSFEIKREAIANAKYEIAELFLYNLSKPDSCEIYLKEALSESDNNDFKAKVMFALASYYRNTGSEAKGDDILRDIIAQYPNSSMANSSRRLLNISIENEVSTDAGDSLFSQAETKFVNREYEPALSGFRELITLYPSSIHVERSLYATGWIYENVYNKPDSAYYFYSSLIKTAPNSQTAAMIQDKVYEYEQFNQVPLIDTSGIKIDSSGTNSNTNGLDTSKSTIDPEQLIKEFEESQKKSGEQEEKPPVEDGTNPDMKKEEETVPVDPTGSDGK